MRFGHQGDDREQRFLRLVRDKISANDAATVFAKGSWAWEELALLRR